MLEVAFLDNIYLEKIVDCVNDWLYPECDSLIKARDNCLIISSQL